MRSILLYHLFYRWRNADPETMGLRSQSSINTVCLSLAIEANFSIWMEASLATEWRILFPSVYTIRGIMWLVIFMSLELEKVCQRQISQVQPENKPSWGLKTERMKYKRLVTQQQPRILRRWWSSLVISKSEGRKKRLYGSLARFAHHRPMGACESCQSPHSASAPLTALHPPTGWTLPELHQ